MSDIGSDPFCASLTVPGKAFAVHVLELGGHGATFRAPCVLENGAIARLCLDWTSGAATVLRCVIAEVTADPGCDPVTHARVLGIEGDWRPFLAHVGSPSRRGRRPPARQTLPPALTHRQT